MFRMSGSIYQNGKIINACISRQGHDGASRTTHVFNALREICEYMDLAVPIWLDKNIREFKRKSKTSFRQDAFVEPIAFDCLTIEVIEE